MSVDVNIELPQYREEALGVAANIGRVRKLLTPKKAWIKGSETNEEAIAEWEEEKEEGYKVGPKPPLAYCLIGGINEVNGNLQDLTHKFLEGLLVMLGFAEIPDFNDDDKTTHQNVLKFLDHAQVVVKSLAPMLPAKGAKTRKRGKKKSK